MIIKISGVTQAHLDRLERYFSCCNWVHAPRDSRFYPNQDMKSSDWGHGYEHTFAKLLRKTKNTKPNEKYTFTVQLEINPYIYDAGGCRIKVPNKYLLELMWAFDLFSEEYEQEDFTLV